MTTRLVALVAFVATALAGHAAAADKAKKTDKAADKTVEAPAESRIFDLPHVQKELKNGLRVLVVKTPNKGTVSLQIPVQTGARNEVEAGKTGFAHFFEHMMFRGTPTYPADAYGAVIKAAGADQNAYTDDDFTNYYLNFTTADLEKVLEVEADRFQNLAYSEAQFRTEALAVKGEYLKNFANPISPGFEKLADLAFTTHTYKHNAMGFLADIEQMPNQMDYAKQFFDRWYRPEYATVIVAGDVELEPTAALVEKYFSNWKRGSYKTEIPVEPAQTEAKYAHVEFKGETLPWFFVGWHGPAFDADSVATPALALLGEIHFGETSKLYQRLVVKEQWVDQFFYQSPFNRDAGLFVMGARLTKPEHAPKVAAAIQDALLEARTATVPARLLADTKSRYKYGFAGGMNSAASIAATLARYVQYDRDVETLNRFYRTFDRVTAEDLRNAANSVFVDTNRTVVSVAAAKELAGANDWKAIDALAAKPAPAAADAAKPAPIEELSEKERAAQHGQWLSHSMHMQYSVETLEQPSESPLIDVQYVFHTGAAYDPPGKTGLAALTAAMITEGGTTRRSIEEIRKAQYPLAAGFGAQVDKEMIKFAGTVHRDNAEKWYDIAAEQLYSPGFRTDDFERLKTQQLNNIRVSLRANNDEEFGKEMLYETIYGAKHPYGTLTAGHAKDLESITLDDVKKFYATQFKRGRVRLGLAGKYEPWFRNHIVSDLGRFGYLKDEKLAAPAPKVAAKREALVLEKAAPAVAVSFGIPLDVNRAHDDWAALWLVRSWLGEHRNSSALLYNKIREQRGMNYGDYAYIEYFPYGMYLMQPEPNYARQNDLFQVWLRPLRTNNDAVFATRAALYELDKLVKDGMPPMEFQNTRAFLLKFVAVLTASQAKQLGYGIDSRFFGTPAFVDHVRAELGELTIEAVNAAIRKHIDLKGIRFVYIASDAKGLAEQLGKGLESPVTYNSEKPAELLAEDKVIAKYPLGLAPDRVKVLKAETVFE